MNKEETIGELIEKEKKEIKDSSYYTVAYTIDRNTIWTDATWNPVAGRTFLLLSW